LTTSIEEVSHR